MKGRQECETCAALCKRSSVFGCGILACRSEGLMNCINVNYSRSGYEMNCNEGSPDHSKALSVAHQETENSVELFKSNVFGQKLCVMLFSSNVLG